MFLTEEEIQQRQDTFLEFVETMAEELYEGLDEDYEMTEEDAYYASIMMEHFVENYVQLSLKESAVLALTGQEDPNQELFEEYIEMALDESIGGVVAGAVHGIKNLLSRRKAKKAAAGAAGAKASANVIKGKMQKADKAAKGSKGLSGVFKQAKAAKLASRHEKSVEKSAAAQNAARAASKEHRSSLKARASLKSRIDTGVSNVKKKVVGAVKSGANKVAAAAGRVAGSLA